MQPSVLHISIIISISILLASHGVRAAPNDGKYNPRKYSKSGKYVHSGGDYVEDVNRYRYVHYDDGDRGRYFHIHIPYDGGYGNYEGGHEPYRYPPYDPAGEYAEIISKYYETHPFQANEYDIKKPSIYLEYGVPSVSETNTASSVVDVRKSLLPGLGTSYLPVAESEELDVRKSLLPGPGTAYLPVLTPAEQTLAIGLSEKRPIQAVPIHRNGDVDHLTTTTTTTAGVSTVGATTTQSTLETTATPNIVTGRSTDDGTVHHNHPCLASSGTLTLSKT